MIRTAIALKCKDGVVFAVEKLVTSKLLEPGTNRRVCAFSRHVGGAFAGLLADTRNIINRGRHECEEFRNNYNREIPVKVFADRLASYIHLYTLYGSVRPFGVSTIVGGVDSNGPQLYMIEPSGVHWGYHGAASGKNRLAAKTEIEKLKLSELTCREAIIEAAKMYVLKQLSYGYNLLLFSIYKVHDEIKDKLFELEMSWICSESDNKFQIIPDDLRQEAEALAEQAVREAEEVEEEEEEEQ